VKFSKVELAKLKNLHPALVLVVVRAAEVTTIPFRVNETVRSVAQQRINVAKGVSQTMNSRHLPGKDGLARAVDLWVIVDGKPTWAWAPYYALRKIMLKAAKDVHVPIEIISWDGPHYQLPRKLYP
jgi:peptidoglycan L-alanyl-D-glutamate endopeptidase CwlK